MHRQRMELVTNSWGTPQSIEKCHRKLWRAKIAGWGEVRKVKRECVL